MINIQLLKLLDVDQPTAVLYHNGEIHRTLWPIFMGRRVHILPGSWNPLHEGHRRAFEALASYSLPSVPLWELCTRPRGKDPLSHDELLHRLEQFYTPVLLTNATYMRDKITAVLNGCGRSPQFEELRSEFEIVFGIGVDTAERMLNDHPAEEIEAYQAVFHVWPRGGKTLRQLTNTSMDLPSNMLEGQTFRPLDISSTELRTAQAPPPRQTS